MIKDETIHQKEKTVSETVRENYRTAAVFKRNNINYCCGGKWPVSLMCDNAGVSYQGILHEIAQETSHLMPVNFKNVNQWSEEFLSGYIQQVHHFYFENSVPHILSEIEKFAEEHRKKFAFLEPLEVSVKEAGASIKECLEDDKLIFQEVKSTFPAEKKYQPAFIKNRHILNSIFQEIRLATENYTYKETACTSHRVAFALLAELEAQVLEVIFLEAQLQDRVQKKLNSVSKETASPTI